MNTATHETNGKSRPRAPDAGIEIALIDPSPSQPRRTFDEAKLREARGLVVELLMNTGLYTDDAGSAWRALYGAKKGGAKR